MNCLEIAPSPQILRCNTSLNVYLILRDEDKVLLHLRANTGYCDGFYSLVAGHVEEGESAVAAMVREASEEAGICINHSSLKMVHAMHRRTNRNNLDLFFECKEWQGSIVNREPDKCSELIFVPMDQIPSNTIDYIKVALSASYAKDFYSESGWSR